MLKDMRQKRRSYEISLLQLKDNEYMDVKASIQKGPFNPADLDAACGIKLDKETGEEIVDTDSDESFSWFDECKHFDDSYFVYCNKTRRDIQAGE